MNRIAEFMKVSRERFDAEPEILLGCGHNWFSAEGKDRIYTTVEALIHPNQPDA